jgi:hypothetical protein
MERYALHVLLGEEFVLHTDILYTREKKWANPYSSGIFCDT